MLCHFCVLIRVTSLRAVHITSMQFLCLPQMNAYEGRLSGALPRHENDVYVPPPSPPPPPPRRECPPPARQTAPTSTSTQWPNALPRAARSGPYETPRRSSSATASAASTVAARPTASAGTAPAASAAAARPRVSAGSVPAASTAAAPSAGGASGSASLSMAAIRFALEEVCASAVSDVGDLLCCPITFLRGPRCSSRALCMRAVFATRRELQSTCRTMLPFASSHYCKSEFTARLQARCALRSSQWFSITLWTRLRRR